MISLPIKKIFLATVLAGIIFSIVGVSQAHAANQPPALPGQVTVIGAAADTQGDALFNQLTCNPLGGVWGTEGSVAECVPVLTYYVIYKPASWALVGGAFIFDSILTLSIDSKFIDQTFIDSSWKIVRDFSNMIFIFILLYTGIQTMLRMGTDWRGTVLKVIIIALVINFSLFFTKVVIDAGNVLAVEIYNSIGQPAVGPENHLVPAPDRLPQRDISFRIAEKFQPQNFVVLSTKVQPLDATIIFLVAAAVSAWAGYVLFMAALLFAGRLIGFWFLMIISPFAFISITFPKGNQFSAWLSTLLGLSFVAPVFLFFIYLIIQIVNSGILSNLIVGGSDTNIFTFDKVLGPVIIAILIILALLKALAFSKSMAGAFGNTISGFVGKAMGFAANAGLAVASGGTSVIARNTAGRYAANKLRSGVKTEEELNEMSDSKRQKYEAGRSRLQLVANSSFDARNIVGQNSAFGKTYLGGLASKGAGKIGINAGKGHAGGFEQAERNRENAANIKNPEKLSIFEEQGLEMKSQSIKTAKEKANLAAATSSITADFEVSRKKRELEDAKNAHMSSDAAKAQVKAAELYAEAVKRAADDKGTERESESLKEVTRTKADLDAANSNPDFTNSATLVNTTEGLLKNAKAAQETAVKAHLKAQAEAEKDLGKIAKDEIKKAGNARARNYADKVENAAIDIPFVGRTKLPESILGIRAAQKRSVLAHEIRERTKEKSDIDKVEELFKKMKKRAEKDEVGAEDSASADSKTDEQP